MAAIVFFGLSGALLLGVSLNRRSFNLLIRPVLIQQEGVFKGLPRSSCDTLAMRLIVTRIVLGVVGILFLVLAVLGTIS